MSVRSSGVLLEGEEIRGLESFVSKSSKAHHWASVGNWESIVQCVIVIVLVEVALAVLSFELSLKFLSILLALVESSHLDIEVFHTSRSSILEWSILGD